MNETKCAAHYVPSHQMSHPPTLNVIFPLSTPRGRLRAHGTVLVRKEGIKFSWRSVVRLLVVTQCRRRGVRYAAWLFLLRPQVEENYFLDILISLQPSQGEYTSIIAHKTSVFFTHYLQLLKQRDSLVYKINKGSFGSLYRSADKSLARPGRKQATAKEDFDFHISYLQS